MNGVTITCSSCQVKNRIPDKKQHLQARCGKCGEVIESGAQTVPVILSDSDFQQFIHDCPLPILVDFYAPSCGPCQAMSPLISKLAGQYAKKVVIATMNTTEHPGTAAHYQIRGVPSLLFFRNGIVVEQMVGAPSESQLVAKLESFGQSG